MEELRKRLEEDYGCRVYPGAGPPNVAYRRHLSCDATGRPVYTDVAYFVREKGNRVVPLINLRGSLTTPPAGGNGPGEHFGWKGAVAGKDFLTGGESKSLDMVVAATQKFLDSEHGGMFFAPPPPTPPVAAAADIAA